MIFYHFIWKCNKWIFFSITCELLSIKIFLFNEFFKPLSFSVAALCHMINSRQIIKFYTAQTSRHFCKLVFICSYTHILDCSIIEPADDRFYRKGTNSCRTPSRFSLFSRRLFFLSPSIPREWRSWPFSVTYVGFCFSWTTDHCPTGAVPADCLEFRETEPPSPPPPLSYSFLLSVSGRSWSCHSCRGWQFARPARIHRQRRRGVRVNTVRAHCSKRELRHRATRWTVRYSGDKSAAQVGSGFPRFSLKHAAPSPVVSAWIKCFPLLLGFVLSPVAVSWKFLNAATVNNRDIENLNDLHFYFANDKFDISIVRDFLALMSLPEDFAIPSENKFHVSFQRTHSVIDWR